MTKTNKKRPEKKDFATDIGDLVLQGLGDEIQKSYLDYSMSVIVSRALPDVRDGMKPVARRVLYSMWQQGLRSTSRYRKSAHVIGDVLAKYHPHGDSSVYDALARLTQDFSLRYQLIDGQGNWGSIDGDSPAAMRYTETKLAKIADEMMIDIEKETVNTKNNYDDTRQEPSVLPSKIPQFLLNGTIGIAVGMATNVPPHNLTEVCQAAIHLIDNKEAGVEDLMKYIKGPDFPTGASIYNKQEIIRAYATGKGSIVMRAITEIDENPRGGQRIIVHEIPYLVNKANLITRIAEAVKTKKLEGLKDIRDESDKDGIRIVIELKKDTYPKKVLNRLFAITDLQKSFHVNMLALVDGGKQPKVLTLREVLQEHINHRQQIVVRRTEYDLRKAKERAHILEGLKKALDHIDEIIATIKKSRTKDNAHVNLRKKFKFSEAQATAILEMRLQTLAGLERKKVEDELKEKQALIKKLQGILDSPKKVMSIIKGEYEEMISTYGDERRTKVYSQEAGDFSREDLVADEPSIVTITRGGYIKRIPTSTYHVQGRGGKGVIGITTKEEDVVDIFLAATNHQELRFFTDRGRVFTASTYDIPAASRTGKGQALQNFLELSSDEKVTALRAIDNKETKGYIVMATRNGVIKKTAREEFIKIRKSGLKAITLKEGDKLEWVESSSGNDEILLVTARGQAIRFSEKDIRAMGRTAAGVKGLNLKKDDKVVAMHVISKDKMAEPEVLVITEEGYGKRTGINEYRRQKRGGSGIKTANVTEKTGKIVGASVIDSEKIKKTDLLIISQKGQVIRIGASSVSSLGRATQGVRVMRPSTRSGKVAAYTSWNKDKS